MYHQLQVSDEEEESSSEEEAKAKEAFLEDSQIQHLQQKEWTNFTSTSATLVPKHQNDTYCPSYKEEVKKASLKKKPKRANTDVIEGHGGRIARATGRKDRHSKVSTASGPRDRRVRLSPNTAIKFYDVQDRLGYDRPSKAIDWLIKEAKAAIDALENPLRVFSKKIDSTNKALNQRTISEYIHVENEEGQFALGQSWPADEKMELKELPCHSYKLNGTMQYSADRFSGNGSQEDGDIPKYEQNQQQQQLNDSPIGNLSLFALANGAKIQSLSDFQTYQQGHFHSETKLQCQNNFINLQSSQDEFIVFSGDHQDFLPASIPLNSISNLAVREDSTFSFLSHNFPSVLGQNQLFYQGEPLRSSSISVPLSTQFHTISYANNAFVNDGLLGLSTTPIIQQEEEEHVAISTPSAIATSLLSPFGN